MFNALVNYYISCHSKKQSLIFELTHDKYLDWYLFIYHDDSNTNIFESSNTSLNVLCAEAYVALEKWAREIPELEDIEINL